MVGPGILCLRNPGHDFRHVGTGKVRLRTTPIPGSALKAIAAQSGHQLSCNSGLGDVRIEAERTATDHYDHRSRLPPLRLCMRQPVGGNYSRRLTKWSRGQHSVGYAPLALRDGLVPVAVHVAGGVSPVLHRTLHELGVPYGLGASVFLRAVLFQAFSSG